MIYPLFFPRFHCRASRCGHSCCRGWEICIDSVTESKYRSLQGPLGEELRRNIENGPDGAVFRLTEDRACPFLDENGLCRLIIRGGEDLLCGTCAAHPRFYGEIDGNELCGLGLSCEESCRLLLDGGRLRFADGESGKLYMLPALCGFLRVPLPRKARVFRPAADPLRLPAFLRLLRECEPIDGDWRPSLDALETALPRAVSALERQMSGPLVETANKIYAYILYRGLPDTALYGIDSIVDFARMSTTYVLLEAVRTGRLNESLRRWSEEIEYSDVNTALLCGAIRPKSRARHT